MVELNGAGNSVAFPSNPVTLYKKKAARFLKKKENAQKRSAYAAGNGRANASFIHCHYTH